MWKRLVVVVHGHPPLGGTMGRRSVMTVQTSGLMILGHTTAVTRGIMTTALPVVVAVTMIEVGVKGVTMTVDIVNMTGDMVVTHVTTTVLAAMTIGGTKSTRRGWVSLQRAPFSLLVCACG
jgi:hypothetical protein